MKLKDLNKVRNTNQLINDYESFLRTKCICWDKLSITKKEVNYILGTAHGIYSKKIEVDATLSGMITEVIQNRIEMLKQELVELGVEMEELEDDGRVKAKS